MLQSLWNWNIWTGALVGSCLVMAVYELRAARSKGDAIPTITAIVQYLSKHPAVPFLFGALMGHFFL